MYSNPTFLMSTVKHGLYRKHTPLSPHWTTGHLNMALSQFVRSGPQISLAKVLSGCGGGLPSSALNIHRQPMVIMPTWICGRKSVANGELVAVCVD